MRLSLLVVQDEGSVGGGDSLIISKCWSWRGVLVGNRYFELDVLFVNAHIRAICFMYVGHLARVIVAFMCD